MEPNNNDVKIARYLRDTMMIRKAEFLAELPHSTKEKNFLITPWETTQIIRNLDDVSTPELEGFVYRNDDIFTIAPINNGEYALRLQPHAEPADYQINGEPLIPAETERTSLRIDEIFSL